MPPFSYFGELLFWEQLLLFSDVWLKGRVGMKEKSLKKRIKEGQIQRDDVVRRLAELAFGRANDCIKLVMSSDPPMDKLDLSLLSEVKRSEKGAVEVRLIDRLRALEQLALLAQENGQDLEQFLKALQPGAEEG